MLVLLLFCFWIMKFRFFYHAKLARETQRETELQMNVEYYSKFKDNNQIT